jgi:hypothetical protein
MRSRRGLKGLGSLFRSFWGNGRGEGVEACAGAGVGAREGVAAVVPVRGRVGIGVVGAGYSIVVLIFVVSVARLIGTVALSGGIGGE